MEKEVRLIDADKLKQHYAWWEIGDGEITYAEAKKRFDTIIDVQPTVDAVEVVRCKDCKWWKTNYRNGRERKVCVIEAYEPVRNEDEYCSWAERREDD